LDFSQFVQRETFGIPVSNFSEHNRTDLILVAHYKIIKISFFPHDPSLAKRSLYLEGTIPHFPTNEF